MGIFLLAIMSRLALRPTNPVQCVLGALTPGVKQSGYEVDHMASI